MPAVVAHSNSATVTPPTPGAPLFVLTFSHASQKARFQMSNGLPSAFNSSTRLLLQAALELIERTQSRTTRPLRSAPAARFGTGERRTAERLPFTGRVLRRQEERMARAGLADRDDLLRWAATVPARTEFPRLIRRLVLETAPDAVQLGFPAGSGVSAGGWDGSVRTIMGNAFVPVGLSVWELSVMEGVTGKADEDYGKRTGTSYGSPASDALTWSGSPSRSSQMSPARYPRTSCARPLRPLHGDAGSTARAAT